MARKAFFERETKETKISGFLNLDGGPIEVTSGIGFFDHMLISLAKHAGIGLDIKAKGDIDVDCHHTVEDIGIALGNLLYEALGNKEGIKRFGYSQIPMDDALAEAAIDLSGRPYLVFNAQIAEFKLGDFETETVKEFFLALAMNAKINIHINLRYGDNTHHIIESIFKAFAHALKEAIKIEDGKKGILSTKGVL